MSHPSGALPDSPFDNLTLTPLRSGFNEKRGLIVRKDKQRVGCWQVVPSLLTILIAGGLATTFLLWVAVIYRVDVGKSPFELGVFIANEGTTVEEDGARRARLFGLTLASITTQAVNISASFVLWLAAFVVASAWLRQQQRIAHDGVNLPTPFQYGLMVKLCTSVGIKSIYDGLQYLLFRRKQPAAPAMLITSLFFAFNIYATTRLVSIADIWLHADSFTIIQNVTSPVSAELRERMYQFGVAFNDSLCSVTTNGICLSTDIGWAGFTPWVFTTGLLVAANASTNIVYDRQLTTPLSVITLADEKDLAVIVPAEVNPNVIWTAPSFGIQAECINVSRECMNDPSRPSELDYNCSSIGYPEVPYNGTFMSGASDITPGRILSRVNQTLVGSQFGAWDLRRGSLPSNPQEFIVEFRWPVSLNDASSLKSPNTFAYIHTTGVVRAFAQCALSFYNLTIRHEGGRFQVVGEPERSSGSFVAVMWGPMVDQMARVIADPNDDSVMTAVNQELARISLGAFSGATINAPTDTAIVSRPTLVSRYGLTPVLIYVILIYAYCLMALGMFFWVSLIKTNVVQAPSGETSTTLELTQRQLADALSLVSAIFPPPNQQRGDITDKFKEDESTPRLVVEVQPSADLTYRVRERKAWEADSGA
ncbi:hypothetical protein AX16_010970 [Volvariella volvacea WC 439]|nr:hypothetical protein AX16_010970 [Volvariella volvacea WC 439]